MIRRYKNSKGYGKIASAMRPSVSLLPVQITTNDITVSPMLRYTGVDATVSAWPTWSYGGDLVIAENGADVTPDQDSVLSGSSKDGAVKFNGGDAFVAQNTTDNVITTEDIWCDFLIKTPASMSGFMWLFGKQNGTISVAKSWSAYTYNDRLFLTITDSDGNNTYIPTSSGYLSANTWYFFSFGINRDENSLNGWKLFRNGTLQAASNPSTSDATLDDNTILFNLGRRSDEVNTTNFYIAYLAIYKQANWFRSGANGAADMLAIHQNRWNKIKWT